MNRLRFLREEKNMSQSDIGKILDITSQAVGLYENEKRDIPNEYLIKLANYFEVSIDYILCKTDTRNPQKIELDDIDIAFASGVKGLNDENKETLKNIMEGLLAKQELEKNSNNKKE